jgi:uncharacterized membrane protein
VVKYPVHTALLLLWGAGILLTSIYDDVIYPVDDGMISIGIVLLFVATLLSLISRVRKDEVRAKARAASQESPAPKA